MSEELKLPSPEQKHLEANNANKSQADLTANPLYQAIVRAINASSGHTETTPLILFGVTTKEYVIVPCPTATSDDDMVSVLQYLRSQNWYCDVYYISESMENITKYGRAVIVSWDPKVLQKSCAPYCYNRNSGSRVPCGVCSKHRDGTVAKCNGCLTLRLWLPGVFALKNYGDPCLKCNKRGNKKNTPLCDGCPAKDLWLAIQEKNGGATASQPQAPEVAEKSSDEGNVSAKTEAEGDTQQEAETAPAQETPSEAG